MDADDFDRAWRIVSHRAPEAIDFLVSFEVLERIIETIVALEERTRGLQEFAGGFAEDLKHGGRQRGGLAPLLGLLIRSRKALELVQPNRRHQTATTIL